MEILKSKQFEPWLKELGVPSAEDVYRRLLKGVPIEFNEFSSLLNANSEEVNKIAVALRREK